MLDLYHGQKKGRGAIRVLFFSKCGAQSACGTGQAVGLIADGACFFGRKGALCDTGKPVRIAARGRDIGRGEPRGNDDSAPVHQGCVESKQSAFLAAVRVLRRGHGGDGFVGCFSLCPEPAQGVDEGAHLGGGCPKPGREGKEDAVCPVDVFGRENRNMALIFEGAGPGVLALDNALRGCFGKPALAQIDGGVVGEGLDGGLRHFGVGAVCGIMGDKDAGVMCFPISQRERSR